MNYLEVIFLLFVFINWILQIVFVLWCLGRNKKLTMLLVEYYSKDNKGIGNSKNYEYEKLG
tara:strand:- start:443 stop:625 length:183 start_codon:yes stop_codon:yes gene_type:complete